MSEEYKTRVFKSGNSLAVRLPRGLGAVEGTEMRVREEQGRYTFEPVDAPKRKIDVSKFAGTAPGLKLLTPEDRLFEERELDWEGKLLKRDG